MLSKSDKPLEKRDDLRHSQRRLWGCLARVESMGEDNGLIGLVIPSWDSEKVIQYEWDKFPVELMARFRRGYRFHTQANLAAETDSDFYIDIDNYRTC